MLEELSSYLREAIDVFVSADTRLVLLAIAVYYSSVLVYAYRWNYILKSMGIRFGLGKAALAYLMGVFVNNITPSMKAGGEVIRVAYAYMETKSPLPSLVNSIVFERITEALPVTLLAIAGVVAEAVLGSPSIYHIASIVLIVLGVVFGVKYWDRLLIYFIEKMRAREKFPVNNSHAVQVLLSNRGLFLVSSLLGGIVWLMDVARLYVIALAVGWHTTFTRLIIASIMYLVLGFVALTPGGLGVVEGGLAAVFTALGAAPSKALAIVFIERFISYATATVAGGLALSFGGGRRAWRLLRSRWLRTGFTRR